MLLVVVRYRGEKNGRTISKLPDEAIEAAIYLATSAVLRNKKVKKAFVYLKSNKEQSVLIKKITASWTGKIKVR